MPEDPPDKQYGISEIKGSKAVDAPELPYLPRLPKSYRPKIGLIGCGEVSAFHLRAYRDLRLDVAALCSRTREKAEARCAEYFPYADVYTDFQELLARDDISVVDITTYPADRVPIIEAAIEAGKHVLSQKPFATDLDVGEDLVRKAKKKGVWLTVNQNGRWAPHFSYIRQAIAAGLLGPVSHASFSLQWDHTWTAGTPFDEVRHLILYDFAIHWFDITTAFFGERHPLRVSAGVRHLPRQETKPPMLAHALIDYVDGQATMAFNGHVEWGQQDETVVCGSKGTIRSVGPSLENQTVTLFTEAGHATPRLEGSWFTNGFQGAMCELLCAIEEGREPVNAARQNLRGLALCFAAMVSADNGGKPVEPGTIRRIEM